MKNRYNMNCKIAILVMTMLTGCVAPSPSFYTTEDITILGLNESILAWEQVETVPEAQIAAAQDLLDIAKEFYQKRIEKSKVNSTFIVYDEGYVKVAMNLAPNNAKVQTDGNQVLTELQNSLSTKQTSIIDQLIIKLVIDFLNGYDSYRLITHETAVLSIRMIIQNE